MMDDELKECAALALRNAFWLDFSALVNKYLKAAKGLDVASQETLMGEMTSIYGRDTYANDSDVCINIYSENMRGGTCGHETIMEALEHKPAVDIYMQGLKVFTKLNGEWLFVGMED